MTLKIMLIKLIWKKKIFLKKVKNLRSTVLTQDATMSTDFKPKINSWSH